MPPKHEGQTTSPSRPDRHPDEPMNNQASTAAEWLGSPDDDIRP